MTEFITSVPSGVSPAVDGFNLMIAGLNGDRKTAEGIVDQQLTRERFMSICGTTTGMLVTLLRMLPEEFRAVVLGILKTNTEDIGRCDAVEPVEVPTEMDSSPLGRAR